LKTAWLFFLQGQGQLAPLGHLFLPHWLPIPFIALSSKKIIKLSKRVNIKENIYKNKLKKKLAIINNKHKTQKDFFRLFFLQGQGLQGPLGRLFLLHLLPIPFIAPSSKKRKFLNRVEA